MPDLETLPLLPGMETEDSDIELSIDTEAPYGRNKDGIPKKKPGRKAGSSGGGIRSANDEKFRERITDELIELSAPLGILSPMAMLHVANRADRTSRALLVISKKHPAVKVAIEAYFDSVAYKDLALFALGIPVAIMMDMGILRPDAMVGKVWNMQENWEELYGDGESPGSEFVEREEARPRGLAGTIT